MKIFILILLFSITYKVHAEPLCALLFENSPKNRELEANFINNSKMPILPLLQSVLRTKIKTEKGTFYFGSETEPGIPTRKIKNERTGKEIDVGVYTETTTYYSVTVRGRKQIIRIRFTTSEDSKDISISLVKKRYLFNINKFEYRKKTPILIEDQSEIIPSIRRLVGLDPSPKGDREVKIGRDNTIRASDDEVNLMPIAVIVTERNSLSLLHKNNNGEITRIGFVGVGPVYSRLIQEKSNLEFPADRFLGTLAEIEPEWGIINARPGLLEPLQKLVTRFGVKTTMDRTTMSKLDRALGNPIEFVLEKGYQFISPGTETKDVPYRGKSRSSAL